MKKFNIEIELTDDYYGWHGCEVWLDLTNIGLEILDNI